MARNSRRRQSKFREALVFLVLLGFVVLSVGQYVDRELEPRVDWHRFHTRWLVVSTWKVLDYETRVFKKVEAICRKKYEIVERNNGPTDGQGLDRISWQVVCF